MESENSVLEEFRTKYEADVRLLSKYIPYFKARKAKDVSTAYDGKYGQSSLAFPVFDSTLMDFVKVASTTSLIDRNYMYVYSRGRIKSHAEELEIIHKAGLRDAGVLRGIFSKYIIEGRTKANRWAEGVEYGIYLGVIEQMLKILDFYKSV